MLADTPKIEKPCDFIIKNDLKLPQDHSLRKKGITSRQTNMWLSLRVALASK